MRNMVYHNARDTALFRELRGRPPAVDKNTGLSMNISTSAGVHAELFAPDKLRGFCDNHLVVVMAPLPGGALQELFSVDVADFLHVEPSNATRLHNWAVNPDDLVCGVEGDVCVRCDDAPDFWCVIPASLLEEATRAAGIAVYSS
jgi:hypothetical protein